MVGELDREIPTTLARLRLPHVCNSPLDTYTEEEYRALVDGAKRRWFRFSFIVACYTGVRVGELRRLHVEDFDLPARLLRIRAEIAKGAKPRAISLCGSIIRTLEQELPKSGPLFPADHDDAFSPYRSDDAFQRRLRELGRSLKIKATYHKCRRFFTTKALKRGIHVEDVARMLGHTNIQILYRHYYALIARYNPMIERLDDVA